MKKEIEIKILNIDSKKVRNSLRKMRARQILKPTLLTELYFKSPTKKYLYSSFRLRSEGKRNFLTLKLKKEDKKFEIRDEFEIEIKDCNTLKKILNLIGFKVFRQRQKIREQYQIKKVKVVIDRYPNIQPYIEVEATTKKDVRDFLKKLEFPLKYTTNKTATEIIRSAGLNPNHLIFK